MRKETCTMKYLVRIQESRAVRSTWLAVAAAALIVAVAGIAGTAAAQGPPPAAAKFKAPKLKHGVLKIKGTRESDTIVLRLQVGVPGALQVDVGGDGSAEFSFNRQQVAAIAINARAGDDLLRIDESNGAFTDVIPTTIDGGSGDDTIAGGKGIETLVGGSGNDSIDGNAGNDVELMGSGNDTSVWDPGDGSDTVEGQDGIDTLLFNGAGAAEQVDVSANGNRLKFFRNPGNITMDTAGVEQVDFNALGGADSVVVNDLTGTDVGNVNVDLAGTLGGTAGDSTADRVVVNATNGNDAIDVSGDASAVKASGLASTTTILHTEAANDRLEVNTLEGTDSVVSAGLAAGAIQLLVDGVAVP
jgi:RTX calcium-binding nonapeptide repeat (4 copies)